MDEMRNYDYIKIWIEANGSIPKDENGKSYEIHHIDGDHINNDLSNLECITIKDHYEKHYINGDYGACRQIAWRMGTTSEELSRLTKLQWASRSEEEKKSITSKISKTLKNKGANPYSEKTHSPESIAKANINRKKNWKVYQYKWYHNPVMEVVARFKNTDIIPEGFIIGRGKRTYKGWQR
jgi:hypothetical protein